VGGKTTGKSSLPPGKLKVWLTVAHHVWRYVLVAPGLFYMFYIVELLVDGGIPPSADLGWWTTGLVAAYLFSAIPVVVIAVLVGAAAHTFPRFNALTYSILLFLMARFSLAVFADMGRCWMSNGQTISSREEHFGSMHLQSSSAHFAHIFPTLGGLLR
jgi:hypothetical protein